MIRHLFSPLTPADQERIERERIAIKAPHLSLVGKDPRPDPEMFRWVSVASMFEERDR